MIYPIQIHNGIAYEIIRVKPISHFFDSNQVIIKDNVKTYRDWLGCDHVLQNSTQFLFCNTIQDVEWEDIVESEPTDDHE